MADAIVSTLLDQLTSLMVQEIREQVRLVTGVGKEVKRIGINLRAIQAVLNDAEQRQFREEAVRHWLGQLKDASYYMEEVLDEWTTARLKLQIQRVDENALVDKNALAPQKTVCSFLTSPCFCFKQVGLRRDIALKIKDINENLDEVVKLKEVFNFSVIKSVEEPQRVQSVSFVDVSEIRGRNEEKNNLLSKLLCESSEQQEGLRIISIVGMGGIGKTTLAQLAYNNIDVINNFEKRMWVCVSDPFDELRIAKAIIEALEGSAPKLGELQSLLQRIDASIARKKFLLILDDVWTEDYGKWEPFRHCLKNGLLESRIVVTTRKETVAQMMKSTYIFNIKELSDEECWLLFKQLAFFGRPPSECEKLEEIGKQIVGKCKGLPLAAKVIGSLLRFKRSREEWQSVLDSEMWKLEEFEKGLVPPLLLSYNDLPSKIKSCFSYCAVFEKDQDIKKDELIKLWMAEGYLEDEEREIIGEEYFNQLAARSFFQEFEKDDLDDVLSCKMHDIVHDFAQFLRKNECLSIEIGADPQESLIKNSLEEVRHSMIVLGRHASFPSSIFSVPKLRSLSVRNFKSKESSESVLRNIFDKLTCLRALTFAGDGFFDSEAKVEIPKEIEKLMHLRYLKLFFLEIEELPEACCELYNLQTLQIEACWNLRKLPQGIGKLVSLRHLTSNDRHLDYMPKEIRRLTGLRTLTEFVVSDGGQKGSTACNLEGLQHLNHLRGFLCIRGLGNLTDVDEAKKAALEKKKNLLWLELGFDKRGREATAENDEAIIEAIRPPPNLEKLTIFEYKGKSAVPNWLMSLTKVKIFNLRSCINCENMPPLGKLPSVEEIDIYGMPRVKRLGHEFLGMEIDGAPSSSSSPFTAFPKLKRLRFDNLPDLKEWDIGITSNGIEDIIIMPHLKSLRILDCCKLQALPDHLLRSTTSLQQVIIRHCPNLKERYEKETGKDWHKISHIPDIRIWS